MKIHEYPNESLAFQDADYYDIDFWNGVSFETKKILGSTIKTGILAAIIVNDIDVVFTDNTTNDVSILMHGYAPKAPNDATKFLDGTGAWDTVKDSDLSLSDITTNDVSITKHGFVPKAPNDTSKWLRGDGTWGAISTGIVIGTTAITSGTDGRVLFQGTGSVIQEDTGFLFNSISKTLTNYGKGAINTNTSFGENSLESNTTGYLCSSFGKYALQSQTTGYENNAFGYMALNSLTTGYDNTAFGYQAGRFITTATGNTAIGAYALQLNTSAFGYNSVVGYASFQDSTGQYNTGLGYWAGKGFTSGQYNTVIGFSPVTGVTTGSGNTIIGSQIGAIGNVTNTVILADGSGNIALRKDVSHFIGIGYVASDTLGAKLDVKIQGALSTDIGIRVRNSANTANFFYIQGDGKYSINDGNGTLSKAFSYISDGRLFMAESGSNFIELNPGATQNRMYFGSNGVEIYTNDKSTMVSMNNSTNFHFYRGGIQYGVGLNAVTGTPTRYFLVQSGTAPSENFADKAWLYVGDQTAGNACFKTRTENGAVIQLYQETTGVAEAVFVQNSPIVQITDESTFDGYTVQQVVKALRNLGILA